MSNKGNRREVEVATACHECAGEQDRFTFDNDPREQQYVTVFEE